jgi:peptidoglycan/xylan/chitin deacetylase (PgdA/CDA1 family)
MQSPAQPTPDLRTLDELCRPPLDSAGRAAKWFRAMKSRTLSRTATALGRLCGTRPGPGFGILMYHRVAPHVPGKPEPTWNVTPQRFQDQLVGLLERGYEAWPLRYALDHHRKGLPIPRKAFVVTFDDGYENVFENAYPVLSRLKVPATVFLATAYLDSEKSFPCDDWSVAGHADVPASAWRPLTTEQCLQMQASKLIELGAHTHTHQDFRNRPNALRDDLLKNIEELSTRFAVDEPTFAFPYGVKQLGFAGAPLNEVPREIGLLCSLSTEPELVRPTCNPFEWGRFNAEPYDTPASLAAKLQGWYETVRKFGIKLNRSSPADSRNAEARR